MSYGLKELANKLEVPILVISSTQRDTYRNKNENDLLSCFKESGDIEYSLYVGLFLEEGSFNANSWEKPLTVKLIKNRHGSCRDSEGNYKGVDMKIDFSKGVLSSDNDNGPVWYNEVT